MPIAATPGNRNWGYDGVLPFAVHEALGTPEELHQLIDAAHGLGIQVFLDVVYNHFGPDGNFLHAYASTFFVDGPHTPWGQAIDFRQPQVGQFWLENALYWLNDFHFDGLRFDAVHAIADDDWLAELARNIRANVAPERHVHLMLENEQNSAELLRQGSHDIANDPRYDAQWNDDVHNALHVLLTDEDEGYYSAFAHTPDGRTPIQHLVRCLSEGFAWQGEPWPLREGEHRGARSGLLPPTAFIFFFLQNHDQVGNRAMGERLTLLTSPQKLRAARVLQLLCPQIPLLFMGEEWGSKQPFLFFTDHHGELAEAVRNGRRREFAHFAAFNNEEKRAQIPDPNEAQTFNASAPGMPPLDDEEATGWLDLTRELLAIRQHAIAPALNGARATQAAPLADKALVAQWTLGDQRTLTIYANFADAAVALSAAPTGHACQRQLDINRMLYETPPGASKDISGGQLPGASCVVWIEDVPTAQVARAHASAELPLDLPTMVPVVGG